MINVKKYKLFITVASEMFDKLLSKMIFLHNDLVTFKYGKFDRRTKKRKIEKDKEFFVIDWRNQVLRYPINAFGEVLYEIRTRLGEEPVIEEVPPVEGKDIDINTIYEFELRDYQKEIIEKVINSDDPINLINLKPGRGKTVIAAEIATRLKKRFAILILPTYIDKWISDITTLTDVKKEEIYVVQGGDSLRKLLSYSDEERDSIKCYIFSLSTMNNYIKEWLNIDETFTYPVGPHLLAETLDFGLLINDESHQEFHNVVRSMLFINVGKFIGLTATLEARDGRTRRMYELIFPSEKRLREENVNRYINVLSVKYYLSNPKRVRYDKGFGYSQAEYENSLFRNSDMLENYLKMIELLTKEFYLKRRSPGDKCLIFAGTVNMCKTIRDHLRNTIDDKTLKIEKYNAEEDYNVLMDSDIIVSTILSSGTAVDIPNLTTVIQTVAIDSPNANKQTIGRLRDLKDKDVLFVYVWTPDIKQHRKYDKNRLKYFQDQGKNFRVLNYKKPI